MFLCNARNDRQPKTDMTNTVNDGTVYCNVNYSIRNSRFNLPSLKLDVA